MLNRRKMGLFIGSGLVSAAIGLAASPAGASETASATISGTPLGGGVFQYDISLTNTSTDGSNIGSFWFSWIPGQDYMQVQPTNITQPTGWVDHITGSNNASDGNAIQWVDNGTLLGAGQTLSGFQFDSTETLAQILGPSPFDGGTHTETTSFVYAGAPLTDAGFKFNVTAVPEPATLSVLSGGTLLLLGRRRRTV